MSFNKWRFNPSEIYKNIVEADFAQIEFRRL